MELEEEQEEMEVEDVVTELEETNLNDEFPEEVRVWSLVPVQPNVNSRVAMTIILWHTIKWCLQNQWDIMSCHDYSLRGRCTYYFS